jgi:hypothetical protein
MVTTREVLEYLQTLTPDQRGELFSYIREIFCTTCGEPVDNSGVCYYCSDDDDDDDDDDEFISE